MNKIRFTEHEKNIMTILWNSGRHLSAKEIRNSYKEPILAYNTIATILTRMLHKGMVDYTKGNGKSYYYYPKISRAKYYILTIKKGNNNRLAFLAIGLMVTLIGAAVCITHLPIFNSSTKDKELSHKSSNENLRAEKLKDERCETRNEKTYTETTANQEEYDIMENVIAIENDVDQLPEYPESLSKLHNSIKKHFREDFNEKCYARFLIDSEGDIIAVTFLGNNTPNLNIKVFLSEAIKWIPARKDSKNVASHVTIPLNFEHNE